MSRLSRSRRALAVITRWLWGTALVTWRYLWETTPLHRSESVGDEWDRPPQIPPDAIDDRVQLISDGCGPLFHRRFHVRIAAAEIDADQLIDRVIHDFKHFVPTEVVDIRADEVGTQGLEVGDEMLVEMPGPWNGPVKVVHREDTLLHLVTLRGHLEAGQVQFRAYQDGAILVFEIELWARCSSRLVHFLYSRLRFAKEVQLNMWVRFCMAAVATSRGRLVDGVHVSTRRIEQPSELSAPVLSSIGEG